MPFSAFFPMHYVIKLFDFWQLEKNGTLYLNLAVHQNPWGSHNNPSDSGTGVSDSECSKLSSPTWDLGLPSGWLSRRSANLGGNSQELRQGAPGHRERLPGEARRGGRGWGVTRKPTAGSAPRTGEAGVERPTELPPPFAPSSLTSCSSSWLDLLLATWLECIWLKIMTCQTWLKNLKKLKRTWMPRRNPLIHEANSSTGSRKS
ncbi:uncharacterized protein LOC111825919 [Myotis lucifugus]|uniref:uncharacterized protein LOC111825919 n=1 Tax=Myotis lucifugus TaxID=59463 RepID=UPI000CCC00C3|nr:uncharacterized protein LOC111825919 [Myotis lucifugus]